VPPSERPEHEAHFAAARAALDPAAFERAWREGRTMPSEDVVDDELNPRGA
jgi:hypothetical protein